MIHSITFKKDFRCFKKYQRIMFNNGVNLLVGNQGTGKSTLLNLITNQISEVTDIVDIVVDRGEFRYFDFEKFNPRMKTHFTSIVDISSRFKSHGESNLSILKCLIKEKFDKEILIIIDEGDMALSIKSCISLVNIIKKLARDNHQIIMSTHNIVVISAFDSVISLDNHQWVKSFDFINSHLTRTTRKNILNCIIKE